MSAYEGAEGLDVELDDRVLRITLNRPDKRNALNDDMVQAFVRAVDAAGRDESVRVVVVAARGDHFCSGFDIVSRNAAGGARPRVGSIQRRLPSHTQAHGLIPVLVETQTPIVARVQGWTAGIGLNIALAADIAIAASDTRFYTPFVDRGFTPDSGATWLLPRRIGEVRAREMMLLGRVVEGREAEEWQLVHRVVEPDALDDTVDEVVTTLASGATVAIGLAKWLLQASREAGLREQLRNEAFAMELSSRSEDFREGLAAFQEKRPPEFKGR